MWAGVDRQLLLLETLFWHSVLQYKQVLQKCCRFTAFLRFLKICEVFHLHHACMYQAYFKSETPGVLGARLIFAVKTIIVSLDCPDSRWWFSMEVRSWILMTPPTVPTYWPSTRRVTRSPELLPMGSVSPVPTG